MRRFVIASAIVFGSLVFGVSVAAACSIAPPQFIIDVPLNDEKIAEAPACLDTECVFSLEKNELDRVVIVQTDVEINSATREVANIYEGKLYIYNLFWEDSGILLQDEFFAAINSLVSSDVAPIKDPLQKNIQSWIEDDRGYLLQGDTTLRLYDANLATELLTEAEQKLGQCRYSEVEAYNGEWMFVVEKIRPYCQSVGGDGASCPRIGLNHKEFIRYNLDNLTVVAIPYLMKYIVGVGAVVWGIYILVRWGIKRKNKEEEK